VFHIFCCVDIAAAATSLAGIVVLILRSLSGTWNLQVGQFGNNWGMVTLGDKKIYNIIRL